MAGKVSVLIDLNDFTLGGYSHQSDDGTDNGFTFIHYYPHNKLSVFSKPDKYEYPISNDKIKIIKPIKNGKAGVPDEIVLVFDPKTSQLAKYLRQDNEERLNFLMKDRQRLLSENARLKQEVNSKSDSTSKGVAEARKIISKKSIEDDDATKTPFGRRRFGVDI